MKIRNSKKRSCFLAIVVTVMFLGCAVEDETIKENSVTSKGDNKNQVLAKGVGDFSVSIEGLNDTFQVGSPSTTDKKVYMHYLAWFGEGENGRHWSDNSPRTPLIGNYDSQSWATHLYHILISSAVGVDGAIINIRTEYDQQSFDLFLESIKRIDDIYPEFDYDIAISYDDQDATLASTTLNFQHLKEDIIPNTSHYMFKNNEPVVFVWDYAGFLAFQDYRNIANNIFSNSSPILLKNELDLGAVPNEFVLNSIYPWVQGWAENGSNWGEGYINWFYNTQIDFKLNNKVEFVTGAVWPGFDDRVATWGANRWINRDNGEVYQKTWNLINDTHVGKIDWVILETWNDFNEGSELEPVLGSNSYQYLDLTTDNIAMYKGEPSLIDEDKWMYDASTKIYEAAKMIENGEVDYNTYYPQLQNAIEHYLKANGNASYMAAQAIVMAL